MGNLEFKRQSADASIDHPWASIGPCETPAQEPVCSQSRSTKSHVASSLHVSLLVRELDRIRKSPDPPRALPRRLQGSQIPPVDRISVSDLTFQWSRCVPYLGGIQDLQDGFDQSLIVLLLRLRLHGLLDQKLNVS